MRLESNRKSWLAAYTRGRHEHRVAAQLRQKNLDHLLPTYDRLSRWSDRIKCVPTPLFCNYIFVNICESQRIALLETWGIVHIVSVAGSPAVIPDDEIDRLRSCSLHARDVEPHPYLRIGHQVRVKHGPFAGWEGMLLEKQNSRRLIVTVEQIQKSLAINLHAADVDPV